MAAPTRFGVPIPFVDLLGFDLVKFEGGASQIDYRVRDEHTNSFDVAHGGAVMTLLDVCMATAARSIAPESGVVTIEMKTTFMQPARGQLSGHGKLLHRTTKLAFVEATVVDEQGKTCAHATGTFRYVTSLANRPGAAADAPPISTD